MKADPPIDEIREVRQKISASVGHDPKKLVERYIQLQWKHRDRVVCKQGMRESVIQKG